MEIDGTPIGEGSVFFIAEAGVNHNGDLSLAKDLVDVAADAGADAVKFQTFAVDRIVATGAETASYQKERGAGESQRDMLARYELSPKAHEELCDHCDDAGITFLSTPFDQLSVTLLDDLDLPAIKVGSGELTNHPLLRSISRLGRPMIVSTGMATMTEVRAAYDAIVETNPDVSLSLLHCVSAYPTEIGDVNLRAMQTMAEQFPVPVGFSDHTTAVEMPGLAVSAGATVVEKHFTLDRSQSGPDHEASLEPAELSTCVEIARRAAVARGTRGKEPVAAEAETRSVARKSLHAARDLTRGEKITDDAVTILRPATGLPPTDLHAVLGARVAVDVQQHAPITSEVVEREGETDR